MRFVVLYYLAFGASTTLALWPQPRQLKTGSQTLKLSQSFSVDLSGIKSAPPDLKAAVKRTQDYLKNDKLRLLVPDRGASNGAKIASAPTLSSLVIVLEANSTVRSIAQESTLEVEQRQEGYTLTIPANGKAARLTAKTTLGLFRGLTTFSQVWFDLSGTAYTLQAPFDIVDSPAYPYRGFMLDTARN